MASHAQRAARIDRARAALTSAGAEWLIVPASPDFRWLTGATARVTERLVALAVPRSGDAFLVAPRLEAGPLATAMPELELLAWDEHEDPLERLVTRAGLGTGSRILLGEGMRVPQLLRLAATTHCRAATPALGALRAVKDAEELAGLREASAHADDVVEATADHARPGMTEREVARFALERFESLGDSDPWVLVASGPNSSDPHHFTSDRPLQDGEVLLLDLGASTRGYSSDITRTYFLGDPPRQVLRAHEVVNAARVAGISAVRSGTACEAVDAAAREVIERAGLGEHFTHRTGHGLGLEVHEPPWLVRGNREPLAAGNVHSVEPGVYFPGRFGIRIEDIVVVEAEGARRLTNAPIDLRPPGAR
ncbi:MAG: aminopeptidase P family protein [Candidatus Eisenbacteria bacterium]|nr:aminopeptidase P family protein [Candidatus Eisenbacteria bacterium]